ncbi:pentapeptide repeat-containing protein [Kordiimonas sp.]|uniref:pentapeptide repeat-containing protein n=1 Tax=Kordiimonas sp. TaxID=1970157 RepID=UPI003A922B14
MALSERSQHIDLYQKGAAMLGDKRQSVRQAGIFALQRLAETDLANYYPTVQNLLCSFVRDRSAEQREERKKSETPEHEGQKTRELVIPVAEDTQTAMTTILNLKKSAVIPDHLKSQVNFNLKNTNLSGANLGETDLRKVDLSGADLIGADLSGADLREADLSGADLREAGLSRADLRGSDLIGADLSGANLREADLSGTNLRRPNLRMANLHEADLREADLRGIRQALRINYNAERLLTDWALAIFDCTLNLDQALFDDGWKVTGSDEEGWDVSYKDPDFDPSRNGENEKA